MGEGLVNVKGYHTLVLPSISSHVVQCLSAIRKTRALILMDNGSDGDI